MRNILIIKIPLPPLPSSFSLSPLCYLSYIPNTYNTFIHFHFTIQILINKHQTQTRPILYEFRDATEIMLQIS